MPGTLCLSHCHSETQQLYSSLSISDLNSSLLSPSQGDNQPVKKQPSDSPLLGMISRCFEPHLSVYITSQDRSVCTPPPRTGQFAHHLPGQVS